MGRKDDRIEALAHRLGAARILIEEMSAAIRDTDQPLEHALLGRAEAWLDGKPDPRPGDPVDRLPWLQIEGGDKLVWKLVSELIALHDREAIRLGEPTWTAPTFDEPEELCTCSRPAGRDDADCPAHGDRAYDPLEGTVGVGDFLHLRVGTGEAHVLVESIDWASDDGWTIMGTSPAGPES